MTITDRIEINPKVMMGKPVIRGTRIPIELILRKLSDGATEDDLLDAYPRLEVKDIQRRLVMGPTPWRTRKPSLCRLRKSARNDNRCAISFSVLRALRSAGHAMFQGGFLLCHDYSNDFSICLALPFFRKEGPLCDR
jgi:uncharacterized protein (DUF433 family)